VSDSLTWSHHNPVRIECAPLDTLAAHVGGQHVLLVTTPGFVKRGVAQRIQAILAPKQVTIWDGVKLNPDLRDLDAATDLLRAQGFDSVVGLGGGSALDAAKVLATILPSPVQPTLAEVFRNGANQAWTTRLPLVAIPTTSGTGAEVTPFATVWDHEHHQKHSLAGDFVYPDLALLDARLTLSLGEEDTLYPALDAISHALESLWNKNCTPISAAFAYQALAISNEALPSVLQEPTSLVNRQALQTASVLAGLAISQTRTAIAHAMSYPLTTLYQVPHGLACSFTLPNLIDLCLAQTSHDMPKDLLKRTKATLLNLDLHKHLNKYLNETELLAAIQNGTQSARAKNYLFAESNEFDIKAILKAQVQA
jgi:phosphonate metabolism-associated iron-containing alcohol dehydrogenase